MHAPHQAPQEYLDKYRGAFDDGWDAFRAEWFERQVEMGIIPEGTQLAPRNPGVNAWSDLSDDERALFARFQEAFAAFLDHTDAQIGRLLDALEQLGELDNTLVILTSDNGASQEGGPNGQLHEMMFFNNRFDSAADMMHGLDDIGGPNSHTNYPGAGPRPATARTSGTSRTRTEAVSARRSSCTGPAASPTRAASATSSTT